MKRTANIFTNTNKKYVNSFEAINKNTAECSSSVCVSVWRWCIAPPWVDSSTVYSLNAQTYRSSLDFSLSHFPQFFKFPFPEPLICSIFSPAGHWGWFTESSYGKKPPSFPNPHQTVIHVSVKEGCFWTHCCYNVVKMFKTLHNLSSCFLKWPW